MEEQEENPQSMVRLSAGTLMHVHEGLSSSLLQSQKMLITYGLTRKVSVEEKHAGGLSQQGKYTH